tara:strand:+ start:13503 stop:16043 length:2541 start_codon:yes stop_codon:yes gene_type:complete
MSCSYEVTSNGELSIRPSSNKISFGNGDSVTNIDNGEISFGTDSVRTRITKGGIKKPKKDKTATFQFASTVLEIDVTDSDSTITVNNTTKGIKTIQFTNVEEGESGICVIYYQQAFDDDVSLSLQGGHVKSKDGNMELTNIVGVYDIVNFYCVSNNTVLVELNSYATIGGTEIQIDELKHISTSVTSNTTAIQSAVNDIITLGTSIGSKAEKVYVDTQLVQKLNASELTSINTGISSNVTSINELNTWKISTVTPSINDINASLTQNTSTIDGMQTTLSSHANTLSSQTTTLNSIQSSLNTNTTSLTTHAGVISGIQTDVSDLQSSLTTTNTNNTTDISALTGTVGTLQTNVSSLQTSVSTNTGSITTLQTTLDTNTANITILQDAVDTLAVEGVGGGTTVVSSGNVKIVPPETMEFGEFSNGTIDLNINLNSLKFDTFANKTDMLALAFDYSGITLTGVIDNPFQNELSFSQVNEYRVALISLSNTPVQFSNVSDNVTLKLSYSELYGPEPFTIDGHYPLYYSNDTGRTAVSGISGDNSNEWSNGDTASYYTDVTHVDFTTGDYLEKTNHMIQSVEILDSTNESYSTNDSKRLYIKPVNGKFEINGIPQKELNLLENCEYTFISESESSHPPFITESATGGGNAIEYSRGITTQHKKYTTHPGGNLITHNTNPEYYYYTFTFTPGEDTPDTLYYQCKNHVNMGGKINVLKQDTSSANDTYYVNAYISDDYYSSETNTSGTYTNLSFGEIEDPYNVFQNSTYTAPVDGVYKFELHVHNKSNNTCMVQIVKGSTAIKPPVYIYSQDSHGMKGYMVSLSKNDTVHVEYQGDIWHTTSMTAYLVSTKKP